MVNQVIMEPTGPSKVLWLQPERICALTKGIIISRGAGSVSDNLAHTGT